MTGQILILKADIAAKVDIPLLLRPKWQQDSDSTSNLTQIMLWEKDVNDAPMVLQPPTLYLLYLLSFVFSTRASLPMRKVPLRCIEHCCIKISSFTCLEDILNTVLKSVGTEAAVEIGERRYKVISYLD